MRSSRPALYLLALLVLFSSAPAAAAPPPDADASFASARGSRVAFPVAPGAHPPLTYLAAEVDAAELAELKKVAPNVRIVTGLDEKSALAHAAEAHAADARLLTPALLAKAPHLVWVHSPSAGVDWLAPLGELMKNDRIVLTNSRAVHAPAIADHALGMLLTLTRNLGFYAEAQRAGRWTRDERPPRPSFALQGRTLLVVGIGGIGSEIGERAHAFGMRVIATRRTDTPAPPYVERVGKPEDLLKMLPEADVVAICVPLTKETERLFGDPAFAAMKPGAILINVARGKIVDTDALVRALRGGRLGGAALDVTDPEPLPPEHPLWKLPNVIVTPHVASDAALTKERAAALFRENLKRFGAGEPLLNVVDKNAGY